MPLFSSLDMPEIHQGIRQTVVVVVKVQPRVVKVQLGVVKVRLGVTKVQLEVVKVRLGW